jgi:hypothetical protein
MEASIYLLQIGQAFIPREREREREGTMKTRVNTQECALRAFV